MIRFCNGTVDNAEYTSLTLAGLLDYFLSDHRDDVICVYDNCDTTIRYIGIITYYSLQQAASVDDAIEREYVVWDVDIWKNARKYFEHASQITTIGAILPVLNEDGQLVCFAYEDVEANREIRMLRELHDFSHVLQFTDIYQEKKYVRIYGFNELAYLFAKYLEELNVKVETIGKMWQGFIKERQVPMCNCLTIYAEGVADKEQGWQEELVRSVSVEFDCIDRIYEANIESGLITDARGDFTWLTEHIKNEKEIVILDTGIYSLNAYNLLKANNIDIFCFMSDDQEEQAHRLFGKKIISEKEIKNCTKRPVFLDCSFENSAWGFGETDRYDYEGYRRNQQYFMLRDYINIPIGALENALKGKDIILIGCFKLCCNVNRVLKDIEGCSVTYWDLLEEDSIKEEKMAYTDEGNITTDTVCLLVEPQYLHMPRKKEQYLNKLKDKKIENYMDYFSYSEVLISVQKENAEKYTIPCLTPDKIVLDISGHMSGNVFFMNLLQGHPNILMMELDVWKIISNLFLICVQLAEEKAENILRCFWGIYDYITAEGDKTFISHKAKFNQKFGELLAYKESFTSQEIFVMIHMAYAYIWEKDIVDVRDTLLYFEQHAAVATERLNYEKWLCSEKIKGFSILISRNSYTRVGSYFKHLESYRRFSYPNMSNLWKNMLYIDKDREAPDHWKRFELKFELLKTKPVETLEFVCNILSIPWDDQLLETTEHGERAKYFSGNEMITGFDLKPVYNLYEEYFSDFDRLRINMIFSESQRRFDYPYVSCQNFSRRQLQEMFLQKFKFEDRLTYESDFWKKQYRRDMIKVINQYIKKSRRKEILQC